MRFWPQEKWKKIILWVWLAIVVVGAVSVIYVSILVNRDVISGIEVMNGGGGNTALVVYQPG